MLRPHSLSVRDAPPAIWGARTAVMGVINITPDSFSGDGVGTTAEAVARAVAQAEALIAAGVDILDVGGESTRPGGAPIDAAEEQARVLPVVAALRAICDLPISIDTYRAETARRALAAGATWINDIWGLRADPQMAALAAEAGCPIVLMHNGRQRARPGGDGLGGGYYGFFDYSDLLGEVRAELQASIDLALAAGVARHNIIIDPGIGFGKTVDQNLELLNRLGELKTLGYPVLLGTSRKGFIGHVLGGLPPQDRLEGTAATVAVGIVRGADIVRVHDAAPMVRVARMTDAIVRR